MTKKDWVLPPLYENGLVYRWGGTAPTPYPTVSDFHVRAVGNPYFGVQMAWTSDELGPVTMFPWWDHLEADPRLDDPRWRPVGTKARPYVDSEQGWFVEIWADAGFVHVHQGDLDKGRVHTWYRVPLAVFEASWKVGVSEIKHAVIPAAPKSRHQARLERLATRKRTANSG
jgi:hypothetical protein